MTDPASRFSSRVENYTKYRPHYPKGLISTLRKECHLTSTSLVADIGSGTGLLTELFLINGNPVFAVEPNCQMREAAERIFQNHPEFHSVAGRAESTTLADHSIDFIVAGQAFHWFDRQKARLEFLRILKPTGWVMLVWNERETRATPFMKAYEQLLQRYATDYTQMNHKHIDKASISGFFDFPGVESSTFANRQDFDYAGLLGRLLSSSYAPESGHPDYESMINELAKIFKTHEVDGLIGFEYTTKIYFGHLH